MDVAEHLKSADLYELISMSLRSFKQRRLSIPEFMAAALREQGDFPAKVQRVDKPNVQSFADCKGFVSKEQAIDIITTPKKEEVPSKLSDEFERQLSVSPHKEKMELH